MIPNAISSVTASHIKDLVADGISESRELDYKKELPTGADGRIGFLKDVAAFANTSGGDLVFRVDEEVDLNGKRTGRASAIPGLQNLDDTQKLQLEQWVRTGIEKYHRFPRAAPVLRLPSAHGPTANPLRSLPAVVTVPAFPRLPGPGASRFPSRQGCAGPLRSVKAEPATPNRGRNHR